MKKFNYFADPIFLVSLCLWLVNRLCLKNQPAAGYFDDLLLVPIVVTVYLYFRSAIGIRPFDYWPTHVEVLGSVALWIIVFELLFPRHGATVVLDLRHMVAYGIGSVISIIYWQRDEIFVRMRSTSV